MIKETIYFNHIMTKDDFVGMDNLQEQVPNLNILSQNRKKDKIIYISSNMTRIIASMKCGFCGIPISSYEKFDNSDFQLALVENYLFKLQYIHDLKSKNNDHFGILLKKHHEVKNLVEVKRSIDQVIHS